mmetsp:Transcript_25671/g.72691  ORF Transcript_25671/g.72691 Transcript_25671/m.72691 type:complete len:216 (-) Transcript_25671:221-868(-)
MQSFSSSFDLISRLSSSFDLTSRLSSSFDLASGLARCHVRPLFGSKAHCTRQLSFVMPSRSCGRTAHHSNPSFLTRPKLVSNFWPSQRELSSSTWEHAQALDGLQRVKPCMAAKWESGSARSSPDDWVAFRQGMCKLQVVQSHPRPIDTSCATWQREVKQQGQAIVLQREEGASTDVIRAKPDADRYRHVDEGGSCARSNASASGRIPAQTSHKG